jgi:hypothetical protein
MVFIGADRQSSPQRNTGRAPRLLQDYACEQCSREATGQMEKDINSEVVIWRYIRVNAWINECLICHCQREDVRNEDIDP